MISTLVFLAISGGVLLPEPQGEQGGGGFGGQGGFGGGGFGGSQGGGAGNAGNRSTTQHILTPGDKAEWPLDVKEGEVIIFSIESTNFDPAIEVVDEAGKSLGINDDIEPGIQNARLLVRFPTTGKYKALITNYRSNAGGMYHYSIARFRSFDAPIGVKSNPSRELPQNMTILARVSLKAGQTVLARSEGISLGSVFVPDGSEENLYSYLGNLLGLNMYEPKMDGDYYFQTFGNWKNPSSSATITLANQRIVSDSSKTVSNLKAHGAEKWETEVKKGELFEVRISSASELRFLVDEREAAQVQEQTGKRSFELVSSNKKRTRHTLLAVKDTKVHCYVSSPLADSDYDFTTSTSRINGGNGGKFPHELDFGEAIGYEFMFQAGDIVEISAESNHFDPTLQFLSSAGLINRQDDNGMDTNPKIVQSIPEDGRYYVIVESSGSGGKGKFQLNVKRLPSMQIRLGETKSHSPTKSYDAVWDLTLPEVPVALIRLSGDVSSGTWSIIGPKGIPVTIREIRLGERERLFFMVKPVPGVYRLWLYGMKVGGNYSIKVEEFK